MDQSYLCATPPKVLCVSPLDITLNNVDQVVEPVKKRGRGRPKKPKGTLDTCNISFYIIK